MRRKILATLIGALAVSGMAVSSAIAGSGDGLTSVTNPTVFFGEDYSLGWEFSTTGETLSALGYNDFGFGTPHDVGIYSATGTLLASATVTGASTLEGGYRYTSISPLTLGAGDYYIAGTTASSGDTDGWIFQADSFTTNATTAYLGSYFNGQTTTTLLFPNQPAAGRQYLEVNFQTSASVPEPATWALMLIGVVGLGAVIRRRSSFAAVC